MKANEIRLSNWFIGYDDKPFKWEIDQFHLIAIGCEVDEIIKSAIPLTEEILIKAGFEVEYTNGGFLRWQKGKFKLLDRRLPYPMTDIHKEYILYVHQLQNLYFALTGEEIKIEL